MADFKETLKGIWDEGVKFVNSAAKRVAGATRYKLDELDNVSRRREAISELGEKVYELYQAGVAMPEEVLPLLDEMRALDENLDKMRNDHAEQKKANAEQRAQERADAKTRRAEERAAAKQARIDAAKAAAAVTEDEPMVADILNEEVAEAEEAVEEFVAEEETKPTDAQ